ncbi:hypothetical protein Prudu_017672 [Prunus dulcis]|uniref:Uncharacterized protein n=1 Tax=Prunus dulcis TaxID=3755 RepID=A0A4Y1RQU1_PRUDU|nr:hypothetical protein Prudu_017672 [Prunus dulcis]
MASPNLYPIVDDKDLDDAALWAVIDSAAASHSSSKYKPQSPKPLAIKYPNYPSPPPKLFKTPRLPFSDDSGSKSLSTEGEVVEDPSAFHPPRKIARTSSSGVNDTSPLVVVRNVQRTTPTTPTTPFYSSPETHVSPGIGNYASPVSYGQRDGRDNSSGSVHSLTGRFPSVSLFKEYQNAAMAVGGRYRFTSISPLRSKTRPLSFDENRNVLRAEFVHENSNVISNHMSHSVMNMVAVFAVLPLPLVTRGGRFSDGWGACDRREKKFNKPNHDIPSTAETRAKSKASQDLLGIGEYRPGASQFHH